MSKVGTHLSEAEEQVDGGVAGHGRHKNGVGQQLMHHAGHRGGRGGLRGAAQARADLPPVVGLVQHGHQVAHVHRGRGNHRRRVGGSVLLPAEEGAEEAALARDGNGCSFGGFGAVRRACRGAKEGRMT